MCGTESAQSRSCMHRPTPQIRKQQPTLATASSVLSLLIPPRIASTGSRRRARWGGRRRRGCCRGRRGTAPGTVLACAGDGLRSGATVIALEVHFSNRAALVACGVLGSAEGGLVGRRCLLSQQEDEAYEQAGPAELLSRRHRECRNEERFCDRYKCRWEVNVSDTVLERGCM